MKLTALEDVAELLAAARGLLAAVVLEPEALRLWVRTETGQEMSPESDRMAVRLALLVPPLADALESLGAENARLREENAKLRGPRRACDGDPEDDMAAWSDEYLAWLDDLRGRVIEEDNGFEPGELTVYPALWVQQYEDGLTPDAAWRRAARSHDEALSAVSRQLINRDTEIAILQEEYAKLRPDADRWRRAVRSCLADPDANGDPAAAVECVSHLALHDAEAEIARLREALTPFAKEYKEWGGGGVVEIRGQGDDGFEIARFTVADLKRAHAALQGGEDE